VRFAAAAALTTWAAALGTLSGGCGAGIGAYCNEAKNCEGGNDLDEEACNIRFQEIQDIADLKNCSGEYDEWFECTEEASRCNDDRYQADDDACRVQGERLSECAEIGVF
jgi:hypothetical protein